MTLARAAGAWLQLGKPGIALLAAGSAFVGFLLGRSPGPASPGEAFAPAAATLLLALGAGALNQVQDRRIDALMERTRTRPVASGAIRPAHALLAAAAAVAFGAALLATRSAAAAAVGVGAVVWYWGAYGPGKRRSAFAALPGSLVGAAPPAIGWLWGGGAPDAPGLAFLAGFFVLWQAPHFWLLLLRWREDYEASGLPLATGVLTEAQLGRVILVWVAATAAAGAGLPWAEAGAARPATSAVLLLAGAAAVAANLPLLSGRPTRRRYEAGFGALNGYLVGVLLLLAVDRLARLAAPSCCG